MSTSTVLPYCSVRNMRPGDTFLSNRSGVLTAVSEPYPNPNPDGGSAYVIDVCRSDGGKFTLVGVNLYRVTR